GSGIKALNPFGCWMFFPIIYLVYIHVSNVYSLYKTVDIVNANSYGLWPGENKSNCTHFIAI
ncbi:MAG: hypothetical protein KKA19_05185, partial [Candidatus Margulisbacteria bacterium]|nr:hypothetical protein [Candidatus Margulisiibacteriota bacterium]